MSDLMTIVGLALTGVVMSVIIKESKMPAITIILTLGIGIMMFLILLPMLENIFEIFSELASRAGLNQLYLETILKIIGIAYIGEFTAQICRDAGVGAIATKVDIAVKIIIMFLGLPIIINIIDTVLQILP